MVWFAIMTLPHPAKENNSLFSALNEFQRKNRPPSSGGSELHAHTGFYDHDAIGQLPDALF